MFVFFFFFSRLQRYLCHTINSQLSVQCTECSSRWCEVMPHTRKRRNSIFSHNCQIENVSSTHSGWMRALLLAGRCRTHQKLHFCPDNSQKHCAHTCERMKNEDLPNENCLENAHGASLAKPKSVKRISVARATTSENGCLHLSGESDGGKCVDKSMQRAVVAVRKEHLRMKLCNVCNVSSCHSRIKHVNWLRTLRANEPTRYSRAKCVQYSVLHPYVSVEYLYNIFLICIRITCTMR